MLWFDERPQQGRDRFEQRVEPYRSKVRASAENANWAEVSKNIDQHKAWSSGVKEHFAEAQGLKCGYCERFLTDYGDVEHYRPKAAIHTLKTPGRERLNLNNIVGRTFGEHPERDAWDSGYWWLAYAWDNYLVACGRCNQQWKKALFPIVGGRPTRPAEGDPDDPLLIDPFGEVDPAEHLTFTPGGAVLPVDGSSHGTQTIAVCGLDRPSLVASRLEKAADTHDLIAEVAQALDDHPLTAPQGSSERAQQLEQRLAAIRHPLERLHRMGRREFVHAGMVRILVAQKLHLPWPDLEQLVAREVA